MPLVSTPLVRSQESPPRSFKLVRPSTLPPISALSFWIPEGLTQAESNLKGWNSHVHSEFPINVESSNLSRDNLSREIGDNLSGYDLSRE